jgi:formylglycine-generating enzyme required for sulfatase activity/Skp family chaperone for outer membrane proteins
MKCYALVCLAVLLTGSAAHAATGILELDSKPGGAEVFIDGEKKGITPETEGKVLKMELAEGDHEVIVSKQGVGSTTKKVFIGEGVTQLLTITISETGFTNSLGMKFVPVPGTQILMCIHETRNKDYAQYAAENSGVDSSWQIKIKLANSTYTSKDYPEHPVIQVNWKDATAFCAWLSRKDGKTYRLPTDHEWSCAVGIGDQENAKDTPEAKDGKVPGFPWGADYPPPRNNVGNYYDSTSDPQGKVTELGSYKDEYEFTAPVMSYPPNNHGIYDLGGNVWEWCQDVYSPIKEPVPVLRGGSWEYIDRNNLASSRRRKCDASVRFMYGDGFRCVVVPSGVTAAQVSEITLPPARETCVYRVNLNEVLGKHPQATAIMARLQEVNASDSPALTALQQQWQAAKTAGKAEETDRLAKEHVEKNSAMQKKRNILVMPLLNSIDEIIAQAMRAKSLGYVIVLDQALGKYGSGYYHSRGHGLGDLTFAFKCCMAKDPGADTQVNIVTPQISVTYKANFRSLLQLHPKFKGLTEEMTKVRTQAQATAEKLFNELKAIHAKEQELQKKGAAATALQEAKTQTQNATAAFGNIKKQIQAKLQEHENGLMEPLMADIHAAIASLMPPAADYLVVSDHFAQSEFPAYVTHEEMLLEDITHHIHMRLMDRLKKP